MKNNFYYLVVLIGILIVANVAYTESDTETTQQEKQAADSTKKQVQKKSTVSKPLKEFTPSEEISIDKPVAFPVDI